MKLIIKILVLAVALLGADAAFAQQTTRVAVLGDSYSTFEGWVSPVDNELWYFAEPLTQRTDVATVEQTWWHMFIESGDYELAINNSYSGSTICNTGYNGADYSKRSFITRVNNLNRPDVILIFGATNDSWAGVPIGEYKYSDWSETELYTFRPAMAKLLWYIAENYPAAKPYFIVNDGLKSEIVESIMTICGRYDVPYIKLQGIDKIDGHPSVRGMKQICDQISAALE